MKTGDRVRIKSLDEVLKIEGVEDYVDVGKPWIANFMLDYFGKEGSITAYNKGENCIVSFDGDEWEFKKEWLEEVKNPTYDDLKPLFINTDSHVDLYDTVERPKHYNIFEKEVIYTIKDLLDNNNNYKGFDSYCIGNSLKYIFRAGLKGDFYEDLEKARYYIDKILEERGNR